MGLVTTATRGPSWLRGYGEYSYHSHIGILPPLQPIHSGVSCKDGNEPPPGQSSPRTPRWKHDMEHIMGALKQAVLHREGKLYELYRARAIARSLGAFTAARYMQLRGWSLEAALYTIGTAARRTRP